TSSDIDLTGYTLQYGSAKGSFQIKATLSGTITANGYYVIADTELGTNGEALPVIINQDATLAFGGTNGKVALVNNDVPLSNTNQSNVVDLVGYGNADTFETQ